MKWGITPADVLTLTRLASLPVLWLLAYHQLEAYLGIGVALASLTDVLDGPVARRTGRSSRYGSQLDSLADILLMGSVLVWIAWLHPSFFGNNQILLLTWAVIGAASLLATFIRFGRVGNLHLYSAKAAGVVSYVFVVSLFVLGGYHPVFFGVAIALAIVGATETLLVALIRDDADEELGTILRRR